ncbi:MAG TPA: SAM-dependent methyltransferase [Streptosporangiaceae bacterium]|nr:SAM-dependent methyltransferase [Streptosporangiaceae bacterium]
MNESRQVVAGVDPARPAPARIYDYLLRGENNFQSDRDAADRIMKVVPEIKDCAWANRGFHQRAARWIAERGIRQFIDIGSGLPTVGNTHEVVQAVDPRCRVVYADNDPMVPDHADVLLHGTSDVVFVSADLRQPSTVLDAPAVRDVIDFTEPAALLMTAVMHFVADEFDPARLVKRYMEALAPGSYLALSHLTDDQKPPRSVAEFCHVFDNATEQMHFRTRTDVERMFEGLELVPPYDWETQGRIAYAGDWGAVDPAMADSDGSRWLYCAVARRPLAPRPGAEDSMRPISSLRPPGGYREP